MAVLTPKRHTHTKALTITANTMRPIQVPPIRVSLTFQALMKTNWRLLWPPLDQYPLPSMHHTNHSNSTRKVSTMNHNAIRNNWIMVCWPLVMALIARTKTIISLRIHGAPPGVTKATFIWHATVTIIAVLLHQLATHSFKNNTSKLYGSQSDFHHYILFFLRKSNKTKEQTQILIHLPFIDQIFTNISFQTYVFYPKILFILFFFFVYLLAAELLWIRSKH